MNQGIPLSWGCTGNALSNQRSIDDEETTCSLDKDAWLNVFNGRKSFNRLMIRPIITSHNLTFALVEMENPSM